MQTSVFLAKLVGPLGLAIGLGMVANASAFQALADQFLHNHAMIYLSGIVVLVGGLAIINTHNVWVSDWRVILTILGWLGAIGGVFRIVAPQLVETAGSGIIANGSVFIIAGVVVFVLGGFLSYKGYVNNP